MSVTLGAHASGVFIWALLLVYSVMLLNFVEVDLQVLKLHWEMPGAPLPQQRIHGAHNSGIRWLGRFENNWQLLQKLKILDIDLSSLRDDLGRSLINCLHSAPLDLGRSLNCLHTAILLMVSPMGIGQTWDLGRSLNCLHSSILLIVTMIASPMGSDLQPLWVELHQGWYDHLPVPQQSLHFTAGFNDLSIFLFFQFLNLLDLLILLCV